MRLAAEEAETADKEEGGETMVSAGTGWEPVRLGASQAGSQSGWEPVRLGASQARVLRQHGAFLASPSLDVSISLSRSRSQ